ncbi:unnamed protein product [Paramecium primaurelia]|uniref:Uncharacterized protein n=1 Tax=Paramecium primaurelia TaxID=5886 RepID=A0A8S1QP92_PARPR|nr:unnamed protein product [Paramecium primaurelia]
MISLRSKMPEYSNSILRNQIIKEQEVDKWDQNKGRLVKTKIQITITQENYIIYSSKEGVILRQELNQDNYINSEVLNNMEQIIHLKWHGEYGQNQRKLGKWVATWSGEALQNVGGYYKDGLKEALWKEPIKNYQSNAQVFESGGYFHNQKYGRWNFIQNNETIGGGSYNQQAQKNGKWTELQEGFSDDLQVTWKGEYKIGIKVGIWDILYENSKIGGGSFGDGQGIKQGNWVEIWKGFYYFSQVTENGEYKNGKKFGRWDIWYKDIENNTITKIGGGSYDEGGNKSANWVEILDGFCEDSQVIYHGEYQNGKKIGKWDIWYKKEYGDLENTRIKVVGLNQRMVFVKILKQFRMGNIKMEKKFGRWDIWYKDIESNKITKMQKYDIKRSKQQSMCLKSGDASYDELGQETKLGNWAKVSEGFNNDSQITKKGEYKIAQNFDIWMIREKKVKEIDYEK